MTRGRWTTFLAWLWRLLGAAIAVASAIFLWRYPWEASLRAIGSAHVGWVAVALLARVGAVAARAERNHRMLRGELTIGRWMIARYVLCRMAADNLLAGWTGIGVQTWLLVRHAHARLSSVVGALALEKYLDVTAVACGIGVVIHYHTLPIGWSESGFMLTVAAAIALLVVALVSATIAPQSRLGRALHPASRAFGSARQGAWVVATTAVAWTCEALVLGACMRAAGLLIPPLQVTTLTVVATMAFLVPGVPSGAGTVEAGLVATLRTFGVEDTHALTATLIYHLVQVVPETVVGLLAMRGLGVGLRAPAAIAQAHPGGGPG